MIGSIKESREMLAFCRAAVGFLYSRLERNAGPLRKTRVSV
ncbi:hypothetical protein [Janthinobacterium sp. CG3]|nr:hypothetical protein [Janthinobacterium sp. CG3]